MLKAIKKLKCQVIWFWPNPDLGSSGASEAIRAFRETTPDQNIAYVKNLDPEHFLALLTKASCLIGNSSVGIRECSFLGVPVVNIGNRQIHRERAKNVIDIKYLNKKNLRIAINKINSKSFRNMLKKLKNPYGDGFSSKKILQEILNKKINEKLLYKQLNY